jgi:hypothetical protein
MKVKFECDSELLVYLHLLYKQWSKGQNLYPDADDLMYMLKRMVENNEVRGKECCICHKVMDKAEYYQEGKPCHAICRDGPPRPLMCIRSNCGKEATHEVKSETGLFGMGYCDKHWEERDPEVESRLLME